MSELSTKPETRDMQLAPTWLGWLDSNQRMRESKSRALPLGYTPIWVVRQGPERTPRPSATVWGG